MNLQLERKNLKLYKRECEKEIKIYKNSLFNKEKYPKHQIESFYKSIEILNKEVLEIEDKLITLYKLRVLHFKANLPLNLLIMSPILIVLSLFFDFYLTLIAVTIYIIIYKNFKSLDLRAEKYSKEYSDVYTNYFNPLGLSNLKNI